MASRIAASLFSRRVIGLFRNPKAAGLWRRIASAALYSTEGKSVRSRNDSAELLCLPQCEIEKVMPGAKSMQVALVEYQYTYGDIMPAQELSVLCKVVRYRQPKVIFEIGTYLGGTTLQLAANSQAEIYTLDLPPPGHKGYVLPTIWNPELDVYPDQPGVRFQGSRYASRIHQLFGDSQTYDFTPYYGRVDFVFVDGCHHYEFVLCDSQNALKMISPDGAVVWHDYASYAPGVVQALNELNKELPLIHIAGTSLAIYHR